MKKVVQNRKTEADEDDSFISGSVREDAENILKETEAMVVEILEKARTESQNIISEAKEEAAMVLSRAKEEAEAVRIEALESGYQDGFKRALSDMEAEIQSAREEKERILEEARNERVRFLTLNEEILVRMALAIAKKIVEKELEEIPDIVSSLVQKIVESLNEAESFKVLVNPKDFENMARKYSEEGIPRSRDRFQVEADSRLSAGGCVVETEVGIVDARLETRMNAVEGALMEGVAYDRNGDQ
jgi:flagellar assembly protein FliH